MKVIKSYFSLVKEYSAFRDMHSGKDVCVYVDCFNERWMKDGRWSLFRVKVKTP